MPSKSNSYLNQGYLSNLLNQNRVSEKGLFFPILLASLFDNHFYEKMFSKIPKKIISGLIKHYEKKPSLLTHRVQSLLGADKNELLQPYTYCSFFIIIKLLKVRQYIQTMPSIWDVCFGHMYLTYYQLVFIFSCIRYCNIFLLNS